MKLVCKVNTVQLIIIQILQRI